MTQTPTNKNNKNEPIIKGLEPLDEAIQDFSAKTVDFFDNTFLGDKRTLKEIKDNRNKILQDARNKRKEFQDEYQKNLGVAGDVYRGFVSVPFGLINNTNNQIKGYFSSITGNPYEEEDLINLEALGLQKPGDEDRLGYDLTYNFGKAFVGFNLSNKFLKGVGKKYKIGPLKDNLAIRSFAAGNLADAVAFSPYENNLYDLANKWKPIRNDFFEHCSAADKDVPFIEAKLRQQYCMGLAGEVLGQTGRVGGKLIGAGSELIKTAPETTSALKGLFSEETIKKADNLIDAARNIRNNPIKRKETLDVLSQYQKTSLDDVDTFARSNTESLIDEGNDDIIDELLKVSRVDVDIDVPLPDTRGQGKFYHGAASEVNLVEGGEFGKAVENLYGDGFYTTDDLVTGAKYQKKNRVKGKKPSGVVYKVTEKQPVKFFDLDAPASPEKIEQIRRIFSFDDDDYADIIDRVLDDVGPNPSIGKIYDEIKLYSNNRGLSAATTSDIFSSFTEELQREGFGGLTHQGGKKAGKGKRLHQVRIYFDPANSLTINKVDLGSIDTSISRPKPPATQKFSKDLQPTKPVGIFDQEKGTLIPSRKVLPEADKDAQLIYDGINASDLTDPKTTKVMTDQMQLGRIVKMTDETTVANLTYLFNNYADQTKETLADYVLKGIRVQRRSARNINRSLEILEQARLTDNKELYEKAKPIFIKNWRKFTSFITELKGLRSEIARTERVGQLAGKNPSILKDGSNLDNVVSLKKRTTDKNVLGQIQEQKRIKEDQKLMKELVPSEEQIERALDSKDLNELLDFSRKLRTINGDPNALTKLLKGDVSGDSLIEDIGFGLKMSKEIYVNNLLGAIETQEINLASGLLNMFLGPMKSISYAALSDEGNAKQIVRGIAELVSQQLVLKDSAKMARRAWTLNENLVAPANRKFVDRSSTFTELANKIKNEPENLSFLGQKSETVNQAIKNLNVPITKEPIELPFFNKTIAPISITNETISSLVKTFGTAANLPGRFTMSWGDEFVKQQILRSGSFADFLEKGWESGLRSDQFETFVRRGMEDIDKLLVNQSIEGVSDLAQEVFARNAEQAILDTFTRPIGQGYFKKVSKPMGELAKKPGMDWVNAFVGTPVNIKKFLLRKFLTLPTSLVGTKYDASKPGSLLNKLNFTTGKPINIGFGNVLKEYNDAMLSDNWNTRSKALGEAILGQGFLLGFGLLSSARNDPDAEMVLVGAGPINYKARQVREDKGEIPSSVGFLKKDENGNKIIGPDGKPERYYLSFQGLDPWEAVMEMMGDWPEVTAELDAEDKEEAGNVAVALAWRSLQNDTFLKGATELMSVMRNPDRFARWMSRQIINRTPFSGRASVSDIAKSLGMPESTVKYLDIYSLGATKIPIPMWRTTASSIKRANDYDYFDDATGIQYNLENPKFDKKVRKGDITKQTTREDGTLVDIEPKIPLVENYFKKFGLEFKRALSQGVTGWDADLEPVRNTKTGKFRQYPVGFGLKNYNRFKTSESENNPILSFMDEIGYIEPQLPDQIYGGIYLDSENWLKINNSIPLIRDENGVTVQEKYIEYINDPDTQKRLKILRQGPKALDSQRSIRYREQIIKELRNGFRQIEREQEERAIYKWITEERPDLLEAYENELEALNDGYEFNLDNL